MIMRTTWMVVAGSMLVASIAVAQDAAKTESDDAPARLKLPSLEEVTRELQSAWQQHDSMQARLVTSYPAEEDEVTDEGVVYFLREKGRPLTRWERTVVTKRKRAGDRQEEMTQKVLMVLDGRNSWMVREMLGRHLVVKGEIERSFTTNPRDMIGELSKRYDMKVMGREDVRGRPTYVIEARPKESKNVSHRLLQYYDREHGFLLQEKSFSNYGELRQLTSYLDMQFDVAVDRERFEYTPPPNARVMDRTKPVEKPTTRPTTRPAHKPKGLTTKPATPADKKP